MQNFPRVFITKKGELHAKSGHPWVFEGEVVRICAPDSADEMSPSDGELVNVFSRTPEKPCCIGTGFYNSHSKIRVRLISTNANDKFDEDFYRRRLKYALDYRKTVMGEDFHVSRLIFGKYGEKLNLNRYMAVCAALCVGAYLCIVFVPSPVLSLLGCAVCGFSVGIFWPGTFSRASASIRGGGTQMFALLALAGDLGCAGGPTLAGLVSDACGGALRAGILAAIIFPLLMLLCMLLVRKQRGA